MVATQTLRTQYAAPFITGFVRSGSNYGRPLCNFTEARSIVLLAGGAADRDGNGRITLKIHPLLLDSFLGLASVFYFHDYAFEELAGGTLSCRNIGGSAQWRIDRQVREQKPWATSLHIGQALDINPSRNRYRRSVGLIQWGRHTDLPKALIRDVEAIKTKAGKRALEWGGRWWNIKDAMHFENDLTRSELAVGIDRSTIKGLADYLAFAGGAPPTNPEEEQMLKRGDKGEAVADYQAGLIAIGYDLGTWPPFGPGYPPGADGDFGGDTEVGVVDFRKLKGIPGNTIDGIVGDLITKASGGGGSIDAYTKNESDVRFAGAAHPHNATTTIK
jgi:hypothetical protein